MIVSASTAPLLVRDLVFRDKPKTEFFITGSLAYGTTAGKTASDVDFVCYRSALTDQLHEWGLREGNPYESHCFYRTINGVPFNAIAVQETWEFKAWQIATNALILQGRPSWPSREERVEQFQFVRKAAESILCPD